MPSRLTDHMRKMVGFRLTLLRAVTSEANREVELLKRDLDVCLEQADLAKV